MRDLSNQHLNQRNCSHQQGREMGVLVPALETERKMSISSQ